MDYVYDYVEVSSPEEFLSYCNRGYVYLFIPYDKMWDTFKMLRDFKDTNDVIKYHYYDFINRYYYDCNFKDPLEKYNNEQKEFENNESPLLRIFASKELYNSGEKERCLKVLQQLEKEKFPLAYVDLAFYARKEENNLKKAIKYYELAAKKGVRAAFYHLCSIYQDRKDLKRFRKYLTIAADKGFATALYWLGVYLIGGTFGFEKDIDKGCDYLTKAARMGNNRAVITVAKYVRDGYGYEKNDAVFFQWAQYAYKRHIDGSAFLIGQAYYHGDGVEINYELAYKYFLEEYDKNQHATSSAYLGRMYLNGQWVEKDLDIATRYIKAAYEKEDETGTICYIELLNEKQDYALSRKITLESCNKFPKSKAFFDFACQIFYKGVGGPVDYNQAFIYGKKAHELGLATYYYACCYLYGNGVAKNYSYGIKILKEAAEKNDVKTPQALLGIAYALGWLDLTVDYVKAKEYLDNVFDYIDVLGSSYERLIYYAYGVIYLNYFKDRKKAKEFLEFVANNYNYEYAVEALANWDNITEL